MPAAKRRLPVLQEPAEDDADARPPWQWVGFGALGIVVVWVPLAWLAAVAVVHLGGLEGAPVSRALFFAGSVALASVAGGYLVGRWGTRGVGVRQAALAGLAAALGGAAISWLSGGPAGWTAVAALVTSTFSVPGAALGARLGLLKRR